MVVGEVTAADGVDAVNHPEAYVKENVKMPETVAITSVGSQTVDVVVGGDCDTEKSYCSHHIDKNARNHLVKLVVTAMEAAVTAAKSDVITGEMAAAGALSILS